MNKEFDPFYRLKNIQWRYGFYLIAGVPPPLGEDLRAALSRALRTE